MAEFSAALYDAVFDPWRFALVLFGCVLVRRPAQLVAVVIVSVGALAILPARPAPTPVTLLAGVLASLAYVAALYPIVLRMRARRAAEQTTAAAAPAIEAGIDPEATRQSRAGPGRSRRTPSAGGRGNGGNGGNGNGGNGGNGGGD